MPDTIEKQVGAALARLLAASGLDAGALARRLGVPPVDVRRLVAGDDPLDLDRLQRVLAALGQSPSRFLADLYAVPAAPPAVEPAPHERPLDREEIERLVHHLRASIRTLLSLMEEGVPQLPGVDGEHDFTP
jgi:transcriptional regulator with XRE-family HTH domain